MASRRARINGIVQRIALVGIELEGGWMETPKGEDIGRDGSVKFPSADVTREEAARWHREAVLADMDGRPRPPLPTGSGPALKGEIVSKPMGVEAIEQWVTHCYPSHVNETCGLHVHMSFHHKINYSRLVCPEFTPWIVRKVYDFACAEELPRGHPQWERVNDPNHRHCAHQYLAEGQMTATRKDYESRGKPHSRYTFVNYCHAQHKTIEVRGLAMFETAPQAIRAIMSVLSGTNEFLSKIRQRERGERVIIKPRPIVDGEYGSYVTY